MLPNLGEINNLDICRPLDTYIREQEKADNGHYQHVALKDGFLLSSTGILVPESVNDRLSSIYGID